MDNREKALIDNYLELGRLTHKSYLNKNEDRDEFINISNQIVELESQIYNEKRESVPAKKDMICPNCRSDYDDETIFCANCGYNIEEFYADKLNCEFCSTMISKNDRYCSACGGMQDSEVR